MCVHPRVRGLLLLLALMWMRSRPVTGDPRPGAMSDRPGTAYFVDASSGSDLYSGKLVSPNASFSDGPFKTIQAAYERVQPGDSLWIKKGVYRETVLLGKKASRLRPIVLRAFPGDEGQVVISGAEVISNWVRCPSRGACDDNPYWRRIYYADVDVEVRQLFQHGTRLRLSRYPNRGWRYPQAVDPNEETLRFADKGLQSDLVHWSNSTCNVRTASWHLDQIEVSALSTNDGTVTLASPTRYAMSPRTGYYLTNLIGEINEEGEWAFDPQIGRLYLWPRGGTPEGIEGTRRECGIDTLAHCSYHTIRGLAVRYASYGIRLRHTDHMYVEDNMVDCSYAIGVLDAGASFSRISMNTVRHSGYGGIVQDEYSNDGVLEGNHVYATGAESLGDDLINGNAQGMVAYGTRVRVLNNRIDRSGYNGLYAGRGDTADREIAYNYITNSCLSLSDGAGIYVDGHSSVSEPDVFHHNIIADVWGWQGGLAGCEDPTVPGCIVEAYGIYLDEQGNNRIFKHNTVIRCRTAGVFLHWTQDNVFAQNTLYDNNFCQILLSGRDDPRFMLRDNVLRGNLFIATQPLQRTFQINRDYSDLDFGESDENRFHHPKRSEHIAVSRDLGGSSAVVYSLAQWQQMSGKDAFSTDLSPAKVGKMPHDGLSVIFANPHTNAIRVDLKGKEYIGVDGQRVAGAVSVKPFDSIVLFPLASSAGD